MNCVLIVGVAPPLRDALAAALTEDGCRSRSADSAEAALPLLSPDPPDLIVGEALLPGMPGIELALRALDRDIPVLLLTDEAAMAAEIAALGLAVQRRPVAAGAVIAEGRRLIERMARQRLLGRPALRHMRPHLGAAPLTAAARATVMPLRRPAEAPRAAAGRAQTLITGTLLADALAYWQAKRAGRAMPQRRDIDPGELRALLPHIQLVEPVVAASGLRFRYRLVGTAIVEAHGGEITGRYIDELIAGERGRFVHDYYRKVCEGQQPVFVRSRYVTRKPVDLTASRLLMPLSTDGERVSMIFAALTFAFTRATGAGGIECDAELDIAGSYVEVLD